MTSRFIAVLTSMILGGCTCATGEDEMSRPVRTVAPVDLEMPAYAQACRRDVERGANLFVYRMCRIPDAHLADFLDPARGLPRELSAGTPAPVSLAAYGAPSRPWWRPQDLSEPQYGSLQGRHGKWETHAVAAGERQGDEWLIYALYWEEPAPR